MEKQRMDKINSFTQLNTWRKGHELVVSIYLTTKGFPAEERYSLVDQMRRAAVSVTSNIAEGFGRRGKKEKVQFYSLARGSLTEIQNQLIIAKDVGYLDMGEYQELESLSVEAHKLLNALIRSLCSP